LRVDDPGIRAACCGANRWTAATGSVTVFINGSGAHRIGDQTQHCGGPGARIEGSPNVIVGESTTPPRRTAACRSSTFRSPSRAPRRRRCDRAGDHETAGLRALLTDTSARPGRRRTPA
jgi:hypothetical protein